MKCPYEMRLTQKPPVYRVSNESETTDDFLRGVKDVQRELFTEWEQSPEKARLSSNCIDAGFKVRCYACAV